MAWGSVPVLGINLCTQWLHLLMLATMKSKLKFILRLSNGTTGNKTKLNGIQNHTWSRARISIWVSKVIWATASFSPRALCRQKQTKAWMNCWTGIDCLDWKFLLQFEAMPEMLVEMDQVRIWRFTLEVCCHTLVTKSRQNEGKN